MSLNEMMDEHRKEEIKAVYRFIDGASVEELASIIAEIRTCHDNVLVFNQKRKSLDRVESVCINRDAIQLNLENI